ncbi:hypothetical protein AB3X96_25755 [Paraburkholderia sp. BR13439]|uniref:hypothetical protein n=1 Tax=Paraburkholderia sp. BR13439 TaxID=3236996 RepID=UPI0034CD806A
MSFPFYVNSRASHANNYHWADEEDSSEAGPFANPSERTVFLDVAMAASGPVRRATRFNLAAAT